MCIKRWGYANIPSHTHPRTTEHTRFLSHRAFMELQIFFYLYWNFFFSQPRKQEKTLLCFFYTQVFPLSSSFHGSGSNEALWKVRNDFFFSGGGVQLQNVKKSARQINTLTGRASLQVTMLTESSERLKRSLCLTCKLFLFIFEAKEISYPRSIQ